MLVKDIGNNLSDILAPVDSVNRMAFVKNIQNGGTNLLFVIVSTILVFGGNWFFSVIMWE